MSNRTDRSTGAAAIATTIAPEVAWHLDEIRLHLDAGGGATDLTATLDAGEGAEYDTVVYTVSMGGIADVIKTFEPPLEFSATDELDIAYANGGSATYGLEVKYGASY